MLIFFGFGDDFVLLQLWLRWYIVIVMLFLLVFYLEYLNFNLTKNIVEKSHWNLLFFSFFEYACKAITCELKSREKGSAVNEPY